MRKNQNSNLVTINVNGVAITCTAEQAIAIASACAPTSEASSTPTRKTAKQSTKKQSAPKAQPTVELAKVVRNGKTVGFDKHVNRQVYKVHTELAEADGGKYATVNGCPTWTFTSEAKAKAFEKKCHAQLTESEFKAVTTRTERAQADKDAENAAYRKAWDAYVAKCDKDGVKRTSEMNKAESARIWASIRATRK